MADWKEVLEQRFSSSNGIPVERSHITSTEWSTIRAHIEGLEAEVAKLRAWAHGPDGVQWHIQQREAAEARVRELESIMQQMKEHVEQDACACYHTKVWVRDAERK